MFSNSMAVLEGVRFSESCCQGLNPVTRELVLTADASKDILGISVVLGHDEEGERVERGEHIARALGIQAEYFAVFGGWLEVGVVGGIVGAVRLGPLDWGLGFRVRCCS